MYEVPCVHFEEVGKKGTVCMYLCICMHVCMYVMYK